MRCGFQMKTYINHGRGTELEGKLDESWTDTSNW